MAGGDPAEPSGPGLQNPVSHYIIGLTGGIGSGKSTVADLFVARGVQLVDTDQLAHELTAAHGLAMPPLIAAFGDEIADAQGALDRRLMRQRIFSDPAAKQQLEAILHPMIRQQASERCLAATSPYVILAVPLLIESGDYQSRCDRIAVVDCPESLQIERVMQRSGLTREEVLRIMQNQATRASRLAAADDVIENAGERQTLSAQIEKLHADYLARAAKKPQAIC